MQGKSTKQGNRATLFCFIFCKSKEGFYLNSQAPTGTVAAVFQVHNCKAGHHEIVLTWTK